ncbi:MAG: 50S ribosomal protein L23 [Acidobacteria bacterium]|nr:50S ribosomal protein L23 [Acidobacteriota bacterium]
MKIKLKTKFNVLESPHLTEKSTALKESTGVLVFRVRPDATKQDIKAAVESLFSVKVATVRTCNFYGKKKRMGRFTGRRPSWKKAFVTLKPGEKTIEFFESA